MLRGKLFGTVVVAVVVVAGLAPANATQPDPVRMSTALQRISDGTHTDADLRLIRSAGLAGAVPDPAKPAEVQMTASPPTDQPVTVDVVLRQKSLLGTTIYKWHHHVEFDSDGSQVTRWLNRHDYLTEQQSIVYVRELQGDTAGTLPRWEAASFRQRHLEYCVIKYGCYASTHPWSRIFVRADGTYRHEGEAA